MTTSTFINNAVVSQLKWINLPINNEKLINLGDPGLLSLSAWISVVLIKWVPNFRNFFFSSMTTSTFIKSEVVSHIKWQNLPINNKKLTNLEDPSLLSMASWIFCCGLYIFPHYCVCLLLGLLWFVYCRHPRFVVVSTFLPCIVFVVVLHFCSVCWGHYIVSLDKQHVRWARSYPV